MPWPIVALGSATGSQGIIICRNLAHAQPRLDGGGTRVYPTYHVFAGLAAASGARGIAADSSAPSKIAAIAHRSKGGQVLWLANVSGEIQRLKVMGFDDSARLHVLDERSFEGSVGDPAWLGSGGTVIRKVESLELPPYGVARLQGL